MSTTCEKSLAERGIQPVRLEYRGDHIPSFKNAKRVVGNKLVTRGDIKARKQAIEDSFASQLLCVIATRRGETPTGLSPRSLIPWLLPLDDCWTAIPEIEVKCELVAKGHEGCVVVIQKIG